MTKFKLQLICVSIFSLTLFSCSQDEKDFPVTHSEKNCSYTAVELGLSESEFSELSPKQRERRAANLQLSEFVSLKDSVYKLTISQEEAEAMGISSEMYAKALNEINLANETIAKSNKEGTPIILTDVKSSVQEFKQKKRIYAPFDTRSGNNGRDQYGYIETDGNSEGNDFFMPTNQKSNVLFTCQTKVALIPVYTCKTYVFNTWNSGIATGALGTRTEVKVLHAASGSGLTAKLCFATTDSNGGRCNWRAI